MAPVIAFLGWGSLIWDPRPEFDEHHETWQEDGPELPLEFARISKSRSMALTLVLDSMHGARCRVAYARSKRRDPQDSICDLRSREGTTLRNIGYYFADGSARQARDDATATVISRWAAAKGFDVVVWTDLPSNFRTVLGHDFSVTAAVQHVRGLPPTGIAAAAEYVWRAPSFVVTPLRAALQGEPWFRAAQ